MTKRFISDEQFRKDKKLGDAEGVAKHVALAPVLKAEDVSRILAGQAELAKAGTLGAVPMLELGERQMLFRMSDATIDRYGDTIDPKGWIVEPWLKSGSWLWAHNPSELPVAKAVSAFLFEDALYGIAEFPTVEEYEFADTCFKLLKAEVLKGCSVGFRPLEWKFNESPERRGGIDFLKMELLECSFTPVPANPNAVAISKALGLSTLRVQIPAGASEAQVIEAARKAVAGVPAEIRAGKVLSKANASKLEQASTLLIEVLESAKAAGSEEDPEDDEDSKAAKSGAPGNSVASEDLAPLDVKSLAADITRALLKGRTL